MHFGCLNNNMMHVTSLKMISSVFETMICYCVYCAPEKGKTSKLKK